VKPEDADVYTLTSTVSTLCQQVHQVVNQLKLVQSAVSQLASVIKGHSGSEVQNYDGTVGLPAMSIRSSGMSLYQAAFPALSAAAGKNLPTLAAGDSYAVLAGQLGGTQWQMPKRKPNTNVIRGKAVDCKLSSSSAAAAEESPWHVFVSRLKPETEVDDVSEFLKEYDIKVIRVTKLTAREEWQKNSAAFHVSVDFNDRVKVFSADLWPAHVQIRDWYFEMSSN